MDEQTTIEVTAVGGTCKWCGGPTPPPKHKNRPRLFCMPAHRAAFRNEKQQRAIDDAIGALDASLAVLEAAGNEIEQAKTLVQAQRVMLETLRQKPRKPRPEKTIVTESISIDVEYS